MRERKKEKERKKEREREREREREKRERGRERERERDIKKKLVLDQKIHLNKDIRDRDRHTDRQIKRDLRTLPSQSPRAHLLAGFGADNGLHGIEHKVLELQGLYQIRVPHQPTVKQLDILFLHDTSQARERERSITKNADRKKKEKKRKEREKRSRKSRVCKNSEKNEVGESDVLLCFFII